MLEERSAHAEDLRKERPVPDPDTPSELDPDDSGSALSTRQLGGLGWGVVVSVSLGVLLFGAGLVTAQRSDQGSDQGSGQDAAASAVGATSTADPDGSDETPEEASAETVSPDPASQSRITAPGRVIFDFETSTEGWDVRAEDEVGGQVGRETSAPLAGEGSLAVTSDAPDGQWVAVPLDSPADFTEYAEVNYSLSSLGGQAMLGLAGAGGWCQVVQDQIGPGRTEVTFDLRGGPSPAGMRCTSSRLRGVTTLHLWAPRGDSVIDDVRLAR